MRIGCTLVPASQPYLCYGRYVFSLRSLKGVLFGHRSRLMVRYERPFLQRTIGHLIRLIIERGI
jgi:hypothetical protein